MTEARWGGLPGQTLAATSGPVTFLFCDLVGSTELLSRLGNEASEDVRRRFFAALRVAVSVSFGEEVKSLGDGLMVAFRSSPADALVCADAINGGVAMLNREQPTVLLQVRIGIATGEALWAAEERDWFGTAVNTAARLCAAAEPDQVLVTGPDLVHEVGARARPSGSRLLKGLAGPVPTWEIPGADAADDSRHPVAISVREGPDLAGRAAELAQLGGLIDGVESASRYQRAGTVLIVGEAGAGKTRLAREVLRRTQQPVTAVLYGRASLADSDPLHAVRDAARGYLAGLSDGRLDDAIGAVGPELAVLVPEIRLRRADLALVVAPESATSVRALVRLLEFAVHGAPVIVVIDDLHHAGGAVVESLEALAAAVPGRLLLIGVGRPDGALWRTTAMRLASWPVLEIGPFDRGAIRDLLPSGADDVTIDAVERHANGNVGTVVDAAARMRALERSSWPAAIAAAGGPYRGLAPFIERDAGYFFGRTAMIDAVVDRLKVQRVVGIVGVSGSGKSSLARAGVVPRVRSNGDDGADSGWTVVVATPGRSPFASLAAALAELPIVADSAVAVEATLRDTVAGLDRIARTLASRRGDRLLVVIDQAEELFTETPIDERHSFVEALCHASAAPGGPVSLCLTLRADFYGRLTDLPTLAAAVHANHVLVGPMAPDELRDAVELPASASGFRLEPGLSDAIVRDGSGQAGGLPLLSHALRETWRRRHGRTLTLAGYHDVGGLHGAIARTADASIAALDQHQTEHARQLFLRLVTPGDGSPDTRRRIDRAELNPELDLLVDHFVTARLITVDDGSVQIAHEALIDEWPRLRNWLDEDRDGLRTHRHLTEAAAAWAARRHDPAELYRGARLQAANDLVATGRPSLNATETEFLAASTQKQRSSVRRTRRVVAGLAVLTAMSIMAAAIAVSSRQRARVQQREAEAQRAVAEIAKTGSELTTLASRSLSLRSSQRDLAALLAVEAYQRRPDASSKSALFGTFTFEPGFVGYIRFPHAAAVTGVAVPGTSNLLLAQFDASRSVYDPPRVVDVLTGAPGVQLDPLQPGGTDEIVMQVSADGRRAAIAGPKTANHAGAGIVAVFDLATGHRVGPLLDQQEYHTTMGLDREGTTLVVATGGRGEGAAFDVTSGRQIGVIPAAADSPALGQVRSTGAYAFGPDGRLYVGSLGTHLRILDPRTFVVLDEVSVPQYSTSRLIRFGADGTTLVGMGLYADPARNGEQHGSVARIDLTTHRTLWQISGDDYGYGECASIAVSEDSGRFWCGNYFGLTRERSLADGARTGRTFSNQKGWVADLELVPARNGTLLVAIGNNSNVITRWRLDGSGAISRRVAGDRLIIGELPDGRTLLVATPNGRPAPFDRDFTLWDALADREIAGLPRFVVAAVAGKLVAGAFADGSTGWFDVATGQRRSFRFDLSTIPSAAAGTHDGSLVARGYADGHVVINRVDGGAEVTRFTVTQPSGVAPPLSQLAFSDDNTQIFVAGHGVWAFDVSTGRKLAENGDGRFASVVAGPRNMVTVGSVDGTLDLLDASALTVVASLPGSIGVVFDLLISDDGSTLVGKANDGTVGLYDLAARVRLGDPIENGIGPRCACGTASLRADGKEAGTTGPGGRGAILWDLDPAQWVDAACKIAGRNLTREEWTSYLGDLGTYTTTCPAYPSG